MHVLVTGGAGFIGSNVVPKLIEKGYSVVVLDNLCSGKLENLDKVRQHKDFHFVKGDIRNLADVHDAVAKVDAIVHLAALIDVSDSVADPTLTHDVNVTGTLNILQQAAKSKVKKIVFASSTAVYGDVKTLPVKENVPLQPISPYAASKAACEAYLTAFSKCYSMETIALRFFNVYGPKNENSPYSGVITKFLRKTINGEALTIEGDGKQTRDFIHVNDIADAVILAVEAKGIDCETFNVCTGNPTSINDLADTLQAVAHKNLPITYLPARIGDIRFSYGDPTKAISMLGFKAKLSLQEGIQLLVNPEE